VKLNGNMNKEFIKWLEQQEYTWVADVPAYAYSWKEVMIFLSRHRKWIVVT